MLPKILYNNLLTGALEIAQSIARDHRHGSYSGSHLLLALLHDDIELNSVLEEWDIDVLYLKDWASIRIGDYSKQLGSSEDPAPDQKIIKLLEFADLTRLKTGGSNVMPLDAFIALFRPDVVFTQDELSSLPTTESDLLNFALQLAPAASKDQSNNKGVSEVLKQPNLKTLSKFCIDKTALARDGHLDPIIGRDGEIRQMTEILSRRTKPNVILVGEPGVGKTALIEGFALNIVNEEVTGHLKSTTVLELDIGALVAGASYKGEFEDRLKKVVKEIKLIPNAILFIDEIHILLDPKGAVGNSAVNLLKPELARGAITVIGATTNEEYRQYIEKDEAFKRRFTVLPIEEPKEETAKRMLKAILPKYVKHHNLPVNDEAISQCVIMAKRFLRDRNLPDSAIDLMDQTMAGIRLLKDGSNDIITALENDLKTLSESPSSEDAKTYFKELLWLEKQMNQRLSPILIAAIAEQDEKMPSATTAEGLYKSIKDRLKRIKTLATEPIEEVVVSHIAAVIASKTGIPTGEINASEREKLLNAEDLLTTRVIGQDHAISIVADAIRIGRTGVNDPEKPIASFFFMGPTGTGKTELTKAIAHFLFNDASAVIRFDMSEYKADQSTSALLGADPGLVGYENGGPLINKIRQQPYAVVLFDEIEKASKDIFDIFLKILDEGKAKDKLDKEGDFSKSIIIFTSNIGAENISKGFKDGKVPKRTELEKMMKGHFRPEFLGRFDGLVPFASLTEPSMAKIFDIHFRKLQKRVKALGIQLEVTEAARSFIATVGFSPEFGARPLIRAIKEHISQPLSTLMIKGDAQAGSMALVDVDAKGELSWDIKKQSN